MTSTPEHAGDERSEVTRGRRPQQADRRVSQHGRDGAERLALTPLKHHEHGRHGRGNRDADDHASHRGHEAPGHRRDGELTRHGDEILRTEDDRRGCQHPRDDGSARRGGSRPGNHEADAQKHGEGAR
jgi:hypothetical protein